jgi:adenylate cyclase
LLGLCLVRPFALGAYPNYATSALWGVLALATILVVAPRALPFWGAAYALIVVVVVTLPPIVRPEVELPTILHQTLAMVDILLSGAISITLIALALRGRQLEQERADGLLDAILPRDVARTLKRGPAVIARRFDAASILFADVVGFTPLSARLPPEELVGMLDEVFSDFDAVVERAGLEKIKTVGDTYMVAAGVPEPRADHAPALVGVALELRDIAASRSYRGHRLVFRFGINSGPVVAGVIGRRKFAYDLWGDAVNVASRMESHGVGGQIHITDATRGLLDGRFEVQSIGTVDLKGRGPMEAWQVVGVRPS